MKTTQNKEVASIVNTLGTCQGNHLSFTSQIQIFAKYFDTTYWDKKIQDRMQNWTSIAIIIQRLRLDWVSKVICVFVCEWFVVIVSSGKLTSEPFAGNEGELTTKLPKSQGLQYRRPTQEPLSPWLSVISPVSAVRRERKRVLYTTKSLGLDYWGYRDYRGIPGPNF